MKSKAVKCLSRVVPAVLMVLLYSLPGNAQERDGAKLYQMHCGRCHSERFATERTDAQWKTVLLHMRNAAPLPQDDADAILDYLQQSN